MDFCDAARFVSNLNEGSMFRLFCVLAWAMWNNRNNWIHEKIRKSPKILLAEAIGYIEAFDLNAFVWCFLFALSSLFMAASLGVGKS